MLEIRGLTVRFGALLALDAVDLTVAPGERVALLGPSGSGKSTLLRAVAGLEPPTAGTIRWHGRDLAGVAVHARGFGLMFQDYVLFPHLDVAANVGFGLRMHGAPAAAVGERVDAVLASVGLTGYGARRVTELSGGEQQRVALARALAPRPGLLMLDEPLGALDRTLRERLLGELVELFERLDVTILYVTHDQEEALAIGDRVAVLRAGRLEALDTPRGLWHAPPTEFVARFLGLPNIGEAVIAADGSCATAWGPIRVPDGTPAGHQRLVLRPEALALAAAGAICGVVSSATFRGQRTVVTVAVDGAPPLEVHAPPSVVPPAVGDRVCVSVLPGAVLVLPARDTR